MTETPSATGLHEAKARITEAMEALAEMPCGGVGASGRTIFEIAAAESEGRVIDDDASYHQAQLAWLLLREALENL